MTGAFVILDRASGPMEKMRREAEKLDRAVEAAGRRMDRVFGRETTQKIEQRERAIRNLNREQGKFTDTSAKVSRAADQQSRAFRNIEREGGRLEGRMRSLVIVTEGLGRIFRAVLLPAKLIAMAAAIGVVVKAVVALGGGLAAMIPQIVGAVGALAALIPRVGQVYAASAALLPLYVGIGTAMLTVKLATSDLSQALSGNAQAIKRLTPEGKAFLEVLKGYKPVVDSLKRTAQTGLFPGLTSALKDLRSAAPSVNVLVAGMSRELGKLAAQAGRQFSRRNFLLDMLDVGGTGQALVGNLGRAALHLADALRHVAVAAQPLARWLGTVVEGWAKYIDHAARAGRETGRLERFFKKTREALTSMGHIIRDVFFAIRNIFSESNRTGDSMWKSIERTAKAFREWTESVRGAASIRLWFQHARHDAALLTSVLGNLFRILSGIGRAGRGTGDSLWGSLDKTTESWSKFVNSVRGQYRLTLFFDQVRESFRQLALLMEDLGVGVFQLGNQNGFPRLIEQVRKLVPIVTNVLTVMTDTFAGPMLTFINTLARTIELLAGGSGPLTILFRVLDGILQIINRLLGLAQGLGPLFTAALTFAGIALAISKVKNLAAAWFGVEAGASAAAAAQAGATGSGVFGRVGGRGGGRAGAGGMVLLPGETAAQASKRMRQRTYYGSTPPGMTGTGTSWRTPPGGFGLSSASAGPLILGGGWLARRRAASQLAAEAEGVLSVNGAAPTARARYLAQLGQSEAGLGRGGGVLAGRAGTALRSVGRFALPIAGISGVLGGLSAPTEGGFGMRAGQRAAATLSGATFGLVPRVLTGDEQSDRRVQALMQGGTVRDGGFWHRGPVTTALFGKGSPQVQDVGFNAQLQRFGGENPRSIQQMQKQMGLMRGFIRVLRSEEGPAAREAVIGFQARSTAMRETIARYRELEKAAERERKQREALGAVARGQRKLRSFGAAINVFEKAGSTETEAVSKVVSGQMRGGNIIQNLHGMRFEAKRQYASTALGWLDALKEKNPELTKEYDKLKAAVQKSFDETGKHVAIVNNKILSGSKSEWGAIKRAMTTPAELAAQEVSTSFTKIQQAAIGSLTAMGYSASQARALVHAAEKGNYTFGRSGQAGTGTYDSGAGKGAKHHARGGRVGGRGLRDTVPVSREMAAPGELVVNRHTERRVDKALAMVGTSLGREVSAERLPHSSALGGVPGTISTTAQSMYGRGLAGNINKGLGVMAAREARMGGVGGGGGEVSTTGLVGQVLRAVAYARAHGWTGSITSGLRSTAHQQYLWDNAAALGLIHYKSVAYPGTSSHERGQAVDVTDYGTFGAIMAGAPPDSRLYNFLGAEDPVHYSVNGHQYGGRIGGASFSAPRVTHSAPTSVTGGGGALVGQLVVNYNGPGDVRNAIVREVKAAFVALSDELDRQPAIGEDVLT